MRNKIDYLVLINLALLLFVIAEVWLDNKNVAIAGALSSVAAIIHELNLLRKLPHRVEKDARPRLSKRIACNILQSVALVIVFVSFYLHA